MKFHICITTYINLQCLCCQEVYFCCFQILLYILHSWHLTVNRVCYLLGASDCFERALSGNLSGSVHGFSVTGRKQNKVNELHQAPKTVLV